jgi:flagellar basal-body rod protein FlgG
MFRALNIAATGMDAQSLAIDVAANNLANVNTVGFKRSRADFQDLLYQTLRAPGASSAQGTETPTGLQVGLGTRPVATQRMYSVGDLRQTGNPLDLAIEGEGFFQVAKPDGLPAYTRAGAFKLNGQGQIVTSDGFPLNPPVSVPPNAVHVNVGSDGVVSVKTREDAEEVQVGQIDLVRFANPAGLEALGRNLFAATAASGAAQSGPPGDPSLGLGSLAQGTLESSNVKVVDEMVELIVNQRAYEMNSRVIGTVDQMLRLVTSQR